MVYKQRLFTAESLAGGADPLLPSVQYISGFVE